ncbi:MAG: zf-TFIIB domain-containing protein [Nitrospirota bacterium]
MGLQKPSEKEEEYFARQTIEKRRLEAEAAQAAMASDEKMRLKELHHMHCPKCGQALYEIEYKGVTIDCCPGCQGVWLDAGELELLSQKEGVLSGLLKAFK